MSSRAVSPHERNRTTPPTSEAVDGARGAMVVVFRRTGCGDVQVLMLHRAGRGTAYEGDWAWTPPAGQREPGETAAACASRELLEETALDLVPRPTGCGTEAWPVYVAEAGSDAAVSLADEPEHDRFEWLAPQEALARCRPELVRGALRAAVSVIEQGRLQ